MVRKRSGLTLKVLIFTITAALTQWSGMQNSVVVPLNTDCSIKYRFFSRNFPPKGGGSCSFGEKMVFYASPKYATFLMEMSSLRCLRSKSVDGATAYKLKPSTASITIFLFNSYIINIHRIDGPFIVGFIPTGCKKHFDFNLD